jgi:hypothetical protein
MLTTTFWKALLASKGDATSVFEISFWNFFARRPMWKIKSELDYVPS